jgi:hypothetical protein
MNCNCIIVICYHATSIYIWKFECLNFWYHITKKLITGRSLNTLILGFNFDDVCTSCHVEDFHNLSVLQKIVYGPGVVVSLPMCNLDSRASAQGPSTSCQYVPSHWLKRISIQTQNFTSAHKVIYSLLVYATFFSQLSSMTMFKVGVWE